MIEISVSSVDPRGQIRVSQRVTSPLIYLNQWALIKIALDPEQEDRLVAWEAVLEGAQGLLAGEGWGASGERRPAVLWPLQLHAGPGLSAGGSRCRGQAVGRRFSISWSGVCRDATASTGHSVHAST